MIRSDLNRRDLLGFRVDDVTADEARAFAVGCIQGDEPRQIVTADASAWVIASQDDGYRDIVERADLVTPDGSGLLWAARRLGVPIRERVPGVDLAEWLTAESGTHGYSVYYFGAAPGVAAAAAENMKRKYPAARIAGSRHGFLQSAEDEAEAVAEIAASGAELVLVAMGIPRQEKWIARNMHPAGGRLYIGIGGSFDVFSGQVSRAPLWMQRMGVEWLYRLLQDPRKYRKVMSLPVFAVNVLLRRRLPGRPG